MIRSSAVASKAKRYVVKIVLPSAPTSLEGSVGATTLWAPEYHPPAAMSAISPPVTTATAATAIGRWPASGSTRSGSSRSTPRNMMTNRNRITIAPA